MIVSSLWSFYQNLKKSFSFCTKTLLNNPKIESRIEDGVRKYTFKPFYNIRNRRDLINLIKDQQNKAAGGVLLDDVQESVPDADEMIKVDEET